MVGEIEMAEVIARASQNNSYQKGFSDGYKKGYDEALKNAKEVLKKLNCKKQ